jgi:hypothetical protein
MIIDVKNKFIDYTFWGAYTTCIFFWKNYLIGQCYYDLIFSYKTIGKSTIRKIYFISG